MLCIKCNMRYQLKEFKPYCYICGLKLKGFYTAAIKALTETHWWSYKTKWDFTIGWSFVRQVLTVQLFIAVLNAPSMNKTPKAPYLLLDYFTQWQIDVTNKNYKKYMGG